MGELVVDITGLDAYGKELVAFSDTLSGEAATFTWSKPFTGTSALHHTALASSSSQTTAFQDHVAALVATLVTELSGHATLVSECVTAYYTSDTGASTTLSSTPLSSTTGATVS